MTTEIPVSFYAIVGALIFANIGAIGTLIVFIFKCGVFVSETRLGIDGAKKSADRAHKRIDTLNQ